MSKMRKAAKAVEKVDRTLTHRAARERSRPIVRVLGDISEVADQPPLVVLGIATIVVGGALRKPDVLRTGIRMLAAELIAMGIKTQVKRAVDRTRPEKAIATGRGRFASGGSHDHEENSFPSGHTAGAVAVAAAVAHELPGWTVPAYGIAAAIGAIQVPRGKHYVTDAVAGAMIGYVANRTAGMLLTAGGRMLGPEALAKSDPCDGAGLELLRRTGGNGVQVYGRPSR